MKINYLWNEGKQLSITQVRNRSQKSQQTSTRDTGIRKLSKISSTKKDMTAMLHNFAEKEIDGNENYFDFYIKHLSYVFKNLNQRMLDYFLSPKYSLSWYLFIK